MAKTNRESEVKKWLTEILAKENLESFTFQFVGNSEKGDGFVGDVKFFLVNGTDRYGLEKTYNLVLKCSKSSAALMKKTPIRHVYIREIYVYEKIFPAFKKFQTERGIQEPFDSVPKCYGSYRDECMYIAALENLKKSGYDLWDKTNPLPRKYIDHVVGEYAKFHAISVAIKEQEPYEFQKLIDGIELNIMQAIQEVADFPGIFRKTAEELCDLLKNDLSEDMLKEWYNFGKLFHYIWNEMTPADDELQVIIHGDCWNNNFMFKISNTENSVAKVAMLDWQVSTLSSPAFDLSYFLFSCLSEEDILEIDIILKNYYNAFGEFLTKLGSSFIKTYPIENFLREWKKYSKYGLMMCVLPVRVSYSEKDNLPDMAENADNGKDITEGFLFDLKNEQKYKKRMIPIIKHAVDFGLIYM